MNDFIARPFDEAKGEGWDIIGDYPPAVGFS